MNGGAVLFTAVLPSFCIIGMQNCKKIFCKFHLKNLQKCIDNTANP